MSAADLFARHLDLKPLRGRSRGVVKCRFHHDRTASLSIDLGRGLFHCFGCGEQGGVRRFAELVGERDVMPRITRAIESPLQQARRAVAIRARREGERAAEWADWNWCADFVRRSLQAVDQVRQLATVLGPDPPRIWPELEHAARMESFALAVDSELLAILAAERRVA
jgi:hypothetical protein